MLKAENLVLHVEDNGAKKCLLDHISFQVDDGEMLVITGPNGGGKSTLAKVLIGIEKAESGKIFLNGEISQITISTTVPTRESDTRSSSRRDLRG